MSEVIYIGGNGNLAKFIEQQTNYFVTKRNHDCKYYLDLRYPQKSNILDKKNCLFVFGAAISSPIICEKDFINCKKINYEFTVNIISTLLENNKVLFLSSDLVFDGVKEDTNCDEDTPTNPKHLYSKLKVKVENKFINHPNFYIARLSYTLFPENSFYKYLNSCLLNNKLPEIIDPVIRYCTDPCDIIKFIKILEINKAPKIVHLSGERKSKIDLFNEWSIKHNHELKYKLINLEDSVMKGYPKIIKFTSKFNL